MWLLSYFSNFAVGGSCLLPNFALNTAWNCRKLPLWAAFYCWTDIFSTKLIVKQMKKVHKVVQSNIWYTSLSSLSLPMLKLYHCTALHITAVLIAPVQITALHWTFSLLLTALHGANNMSGESGSDILLSIRPRRCRVPLAWNGAPGFDHFSPLYVVLYPHPPNPVNPPNPIQSTRWNWAQLRKDKAHNSMKQMPTLEVPQRMRI